MEKAWRQRNPKVLFFVDSRVCDLGGGLVNLLHGLSARRL